MLIKCLIKRQGGTQVTIDDSVYTFKPDATTSDHFCEVVDEKHIDAFLSAPEAYKEVTAKTNKPKEPPKELPKEQQLEPAQDTPTEPQAKSEAKKISK